MKEFYPIGKRKETLILLGLLFLFSSVLTPACHQRTQPEEFAVPALQPVRLPGLTNTFRVSAVLYRGAQPTREGFLQLKRLGVRTVINLRNENEEKTWVEQAGLSYIHIPMSAFFPSRKKYTRLLDFISDPNYFPVFIHCKRGADRTGAAFALYRIYFQGWKFSEAMNEMTNGPYGFHSIHNNLKSFVRHFSWNPPESEEAEAPDIFSKEAK